MFSKLMGKNTISNKIIWILLVASNASLAIVFLVVIFSDTLFLKSMLKASFLNNQKVMIEHASEHIHNDNQKIVHDMLQTYSKDPDIISIKVVRADAGNEQIFASFEGVAAKSATNLEFILRKLATLNFSAPLQINDSKVGTFYFEVYSQEMRTLIGLLSGILVLTLLLTNSMAWFLAKYLRKRISDPILKLAEVSYQVTTYNDYALRSSLVSSDEVGLLSDNFNQMLEQIQLRDRMLEEKVEQRTYELEKLNDRLSYDAHHDVLTGLPNRNLFADRASQALKDSDRSKHKVAIFFIDLDNFKTINDTLGHDVGDKLLQIVAQRIQNIVRKSDTVSRFGGDEFNILLREIDEASSAELIARKILKDLQKPMLVETHMLNVTASIGLAIYPDHAKSVTVLQQHADTAMYSAKERGKNKYQVYTDALNVQNNERLVLISDLRNAVLNNEFELVYQPKVDAKDDSVFGIEALIRWNHPEKGLVMPDRFIPFAEESGIIVDIDLWVLRTACHQVHKWNQQYNREISLAVNMSSHHFSDDEFIDVLNDILTETGMPAENLEFELTERVLVDSGDLTMMNLKALKALGSRLSIDDFGTGYSSLNYLRQFPIDIVKIDKSFISDLTLEPDDATLTLAMILLAKSLSLDVVAEGVETAAQKEMLLAYGCHLMQGYYFFKPLKADIFEEDVMKAMPVDNIHYLDSTSGEENRVS